MVVWTTGARLEGTAHAWTVGTRLAVVVVAVVAGMSASMMVFFLGTRAAALTCAAATMASREAGGMSRAGSPFAVDGPALMSFALFARAPVVEPGAGADEDVVDVAAGTEVELPSLANATGTLIACAHSPGV